MSLIHRLFGAQSDATVLCPRCEHALEGHDDADCQRRMSRRYFFGTVIGAATIAGATIRGGAFHWAPEGVNLVPVDIFIGGAWAKIDGRIPKNEIWFGARERISLGWSGSTRFKSNPKGNKQWPLNLD